MPTRRSRSAARARPRKRRYVVLIERGPRNLSAYVPDLPGCVATGKTPAEVRRRIREAMAFHIELLERYGDPVPEPTSDCAMVKIG